MNSEKEILSCVRNDASGHNVTSTEQRPPLLCTTSEQRSMFCQGSMGLHQNNFKDPLNTNIATGIHENTIVEVFRRFCDRCLLKFRDGMHIGASGKNKSKVNIEDRGSSGLLERQSDEESIGIDNLPFYCKLIILSKLDTTDICNLSMTSRHWREVCSDQFLWRELLYRDMLRWHSVGHKSYPLAPLGEFCEVVPVETQRNEEENHNIEMEARDTDDMFLPQTAYDLRARLCFKKAVNFKALYFHSAYQRHLETQVIGVAYSPDETKKYDSGTVEQDSISNTEQQLASNQSFPRFLRSLWMRMRSGNGDVIMLGPGMESPNTSKIFRRLLWARPDLLMTQRLLPGSQDGVGSGVELDFKGEKRFNLIALYSGNHRERRNRFGLQRLRRSNIVEQVENNDFANIGCEYAGTHEPNEPSSCTVIKAKSPVKFKLRELVLNFLKQRVDTYRLIYVVDATQGVPLSQLACNRHEIQALLEGIRSCENSLQESEDQTRAVQRHHSGEASALSSIINFTGISSTSPPVGPRRPVLILCCVQFSYVARIPCVEIASLLDLASITDRPWHVQDVTVNDLNGLESGLIWLFKQS